MPSAMIRAMHTADTSKLPKLLLLGVASATLAIGAASAASRRRHDRTPCRPAPAHTEAEHTMDSAPARSRSMAPLKRARRGRGILHGRGRGDRRVQLGGRGADRARRSRRSSPRRPKRSRSAVDDCHRQRRGRARRPGVRRAVRGDVRLRAGQLRIRRAQRRRCRSTPSAASPKRCRRDRPSSRLENIGEEVHEIIIVRINDDVTLDPRRAARPARRGIGHDGHARPAVRRLPWHGQSTIVDLTPGRYVAICFFPEGATPMFEQMMAAEEGRRGRPDGRPRGRRGSAPTGPNTRT